jgi:hypothetical protein
MFICCCCGCCCASTQHDHTRAQNTELDKGYDLPERTMHNWTRANTRMGTKPTVIQSFPHHASICRIVRNRSNARASGCALLLEISRSFFLQFFLHYMACNCCGSLRFSATILKAKGYDCRHVFCRDAGHVDGRAVASTLAGGLVWLWHGFEGFSAV